MFHLQGFCKEHSDDKDNTYDQITSLVLVEYAHDVGSTNLSHRPWKSILQPEKRGNHYLARLSCFTFLVEMLRLVSNWSRGYTKLRPIY